MRFATIYFCKLSLEVCTAGMITLKRILYKKFWGVSTALNQPEIASRGFFFFFCKREEYINQTRRIYGPICERGQWRKRYGTELEALYIEPNIVNTRESQMKTLKVR